MRCRYYTGLDAARLTARLLRQEQLLIENSLIHYLVVSVVSCIFSIGAAVLWDRSRKTAAGMTEHAGGPMARTANDSRGSDGYDSSDRAWIEVHTDHLEHNVRALRKSMPEHCELMAVVKAQAYGHGAYEIASCLSRMGVKAFAVATIDEAKELRSYGIRGEILILGYTSPLRAKELHDYHLIQTLTDYDYAVLLSRQGYSVRVHMKINTGMNRLGFEASDVMHCAAAFSLPHLKLCGIYTHLCVADSLAKEDVHFTRQQIQLFYRLFNQLLDQLPPQKVRLMKVHIQSSYGLLNYPELECDYVRAGIALYGVQSSMGQQTRQRKELQPVLSLKTHVILLRKLKAGASISYGRTFIAERDMIIAVLPIGYADGLPRSLSGSGSCVLIRGQRAPIAGRICMDQLVVDVTQIRGIMCGDIATLIGRDGEEKITAEEVAEKSGSITNELLSRLGTRLVHRVVRD